MRRLIVVKSRFHVDAADGIIDAVLFVPIIAHDVLHVLEVGARRIKDRLLALRNPYHTLGVVVPGAAKSVSIIVRTRRDFKGSCDVAENRAGRKVQRRLTAPI
jgi:hypothetical protein